MTAFVAAMGTGCAARVDPLAAERTVLRALASAPVESEPERHIAVVASSQVLADLAFMALANGESGSGSFTLETPFGTGEFAVEPLEVREALSTRSADCAGCVRLGGTITGMVHGQMGALDLNTRAGVHLDLPVQVRAETNEGGSDLIVTPRWDDSAAIDIQLLGLPLGGMGINGQLKQGVRQALVGQSFTVAHLPADGFFPLRGLVVEPGERVYASLRVNGATPAPVAPTELDDGLWVGLSTQTLLAWGEAYGLQHSTDKWSFRPSDLAVSDNRVTGVLDLWRHRAKPKLRQYEVQLEVAKVDGRWVLVDPVVRRVNRRGIDLVSGVILGQIRKQIRTLQTGDSLFGGELTFGSQTLLWSVDDVVADDGRVEVRLGLARP